jgi:hypothetical protein
MPGAETDLGLLSENVDRIEMLRRAVSVSITALASQHFGCASRFPSGDREEEGLCTVQHVGQRLIVDFSTTGEFEGHRLTFIRTTTLDGADVMDTTSIRHAALGLLLRSVTTDGPGGLVQNKVEFGAAINGIKQVSFATQDGKFFKGEVDGRQLVPFAGPPARLELVFADGQPPPHVAAPPGLDKAVGKVVEKARKRLPSCAASLRRLVPPGSSSVLTILASHQMQFASNPKAHHACHEFIAGCYAADAACGVLICIGFLVIACSVGGQLVCDAKDAPDGRPIEPPELGPVIAIPEVGGLHHRYVRRAA